MRISDRSSPAESRDDPRRLPASGDRCLIREKNQTGGKLYIVTPRQSLAIKSREVFSPALEAGRFCIAVAIKRDAVPGPPRVVPGRAMADPNRPPLAEVNGRPDIVPGRSPIAEP